MAKKTGKTAAKAVKTMKAPRISAPSKVRGKSEIYKTIAEHTGLARKQVVSVFDTLGNLIATDLKSKIGTFVVPGMMKIVVIHKPASKGGMKPNPFKPGEMMEVKPKPARNVVKVRPLRALKSMV